MLSHKLENWKAHTTLKGVNYASGRPKSLDSLMYLPEPRLSHKGSLYFTKLNKNSPDLERPAYPHFALLFFAICWL